MPLNLTKILVAHAGGLPGNATVAMREIREKLLRCGAHAINNLLGRSEISPAELDEIIQEVENRERCVDDTILWDKFADSSIENHFRRTCHYISLCGKAGILFSKKKYLCRLKKDNEMALRRQSHN